MNTGKFRDNRVYYPETGTCLKPVRRPRSNISNLGNEVLDLDNEVSELGNEVMKLKGELSEVKKDSGIMFDTLIRLWNIVQDFSSDLFNLRSRDEMSDARRKECKKWFKPTLFAIAVYLVFFCWVIKRVSIFILNK